MQRTNTQNLLIKRPSLWRLADLGDSADRPFSWRAVQRSGWHSPLFVPMPAKSVPRRNSDSPDFPRKSFGFGPEEAAADEFIFRPKVPGLADPQDTAHGVDAVPVPSQRDIFI